MVFILSFLLTLLNPWADPQMSTVYEWKQLDFTFPNNMARNNWKQNNTFPLDAEFSWKDPKRRMFVTTPKFLNGVPASLSTVQDEFFGSRLKPYPSWDFHSDSDCDKIISVPRIKITDCGQLWVIDSGVNNALSSFNALCPPKLLVFDLKTDKVIWKYEIPNRDFQLNTSLLGTVDVNGVCGKEHAYIADITGYAIVVVDRARNKSWKVQNQLTTFEPDATHYKIAGQEFDLQDGVTSVISSKDLLYFHSLSGTREHWVPLNVINNENNFINNNNSTRGFQTAPAGRTWQSGPEALACKGDVMLLSNLPDSSLYCCKTKTIQKPHDLHRIFRNTDTFKFASGLKLVKGFDGSEYLLAVTSPFGNIMNGNVNVNTVNYRILKAPVKYLLMNTPCSKN